MTILHGDCREVLKTLADGSVHVVVTSPPYFGLRDYGTAKWSGGNNPGCDHAKSVWDGPKQTQGAQSGHASKSDRLRRRECIKCGASRTDSQLGLEQTPGDYVAEMVAVFREVRRVLRDDGTLWLNLGDSFASGGGTGAQGTQGQRFDRRHTQETLGDQRNWPDLGLKPKDLMGMPWRVAFALQADGWWLRQDNIWAKKNCMPESVRDRTTRAHEYVFQLTKSGSSKFWTHRDLAGVREEPSPDHRWINRETKEEASACPDGWPGAGKDFWRRINLWTGQDYFYDAVAIEEEGDIPAGTKAAKGSAKRSGESGVNSRPPEYAVYTGKRNKRSVWHVATQPFAEAHFATMPPAIVETCVLAGSSERGCCSACGAPWTRQTEKELAFASGSGRSGVKPVGKGAGGTQTDSGSYDVRMGPVVTTKTTGWVPSCSCDAGKPVPCVVLDPFGGAFTTGLVADRLGRDAIMIELNPEYVAMGRGRIERDAGLFAEVTTV